MSGTFVDRRSTMGAVRSRTASSTARASRWDGSLLQEAGSEPPHDTKHHYTTHPESRLAQNEWSKQLQHGVNEACEPPVLADRQLEGCSATTSPRSKFMIERQKATFPGFFFTRARSVAIRSRPHTETEPTQ